MSLPSIASLFNQAESGGSTFQGPSGGYANWAYQQFPAFVSQYGAGEAGVNNFIQSYANRYPNATIGDAYSAYVQNTGGPFMSWQSLSTPSQPGAVGAYQNFSNILLQNNVSPNTPLSSWLGLGSTTTTTPSDTYPALQPDIPFASGTTPTFDIPNGMLSSDTGTNYGDITGYQVAGVNAPTTSSSEIYPMSSPDTQFTGIYSGIASAPNMADIPSSSLTGTTASGATGATPSLGGAFGSPLTNTGSLSSLGLSGGDITGYQVAGVNAPSAPTYSGSNAPGYSTPATAQQLPPAVVQAGDTASAGAAQAGSLTSNAITKATQAGTATAIGWLQSLETYTSTAFVYAAVVILGVIFVAFGLGLFNKRTIQMVAA